MIRVGNAPLSYGAFEMTVGIFPNVPGPEELTAEVASAGYEGIELGPPGYLGDGDELRERLERRGLVLTGGWCPVRFSEPAHWEEDLAELGLDEAGWRRFADGLRRAEELARDRGFEPTFHAHTSTFVEAPWEIDRVLELSDIGLLVDTGHLLIGGSDPVQALRDWGSRVNYVHIKDVRLDVLRGVVRDHAGAIEAWQRGIFCELGSGDVDLDGFFRELRAVGYDGWICVEQDRILRDDEPISESAEAQRRNRAWLREHAGL